MVNLDYRVVAPQPLLDGFLGHRHDIILPCAVAWAADGADQGPDQGSGLESFGTNYRSGHQSVGQIKALDIRVSDLSNRVGGTEQKLEDFRKDVSGRFNTLDQKLDRRVDALDQKVDRVMAFQMAMLLAIVGTLITAVLKHWP